MIFRNRADAGRQLAARLAAYVNRPNSLILGLPRGGVPVAYEVALALHAPLDVFLVRKLGVPGHEELAMGAIAMGGVRVLNQDVVSALGIPDDVIESVAAREQREMERRDQVYRDGRPPPSVSGKIVILVDDGIATGSTIRAAVAALRRSAPAYIIIAVPVAVPAIYEELSRQVDGMVCVETPEPFYAVGVWYQDFSPTTDEEIRDLLNQAGQHLARADKPGR